MDGKRLRIERRTVSRNTVWLVLGSVGVAVAIALLSLRAAWGITTGVIGLVVGAAALILQEMRTSAPRSLEVVFVSPSDSWFSQQIWQGLQEKLRAETRLELRKDVPRVASDSGSVAAQVARIRDLRRHPPDALVIRPVAVEDSLMQELAGLAAEGVLIVFVNSRPPLGAWRSANAPLPRFVGCDMEAAGLLVGEISSKAAREHHADGILLIEGPSTKQSNRTRTACALRALLAQGVSVPVRALKVDDFAPREVASAVSSGLAQLDGELGSPAERVVVCPGTDRAASFLCQWLHQIGAVVGGVAREIYIVGCDGLRQPDGRLLIAELPAAVGTVDQQPYVIGQEAGAQVLAAAEGRLPQHPQTVVVQPRVVRE